MAFNLKDILRDLGSKPIPQKWDQVGDQYRPHTGGIEIQTGFSAGAVSVTTSAAEIKVGASALTGRRKMSFRVIGDDAVYIGSTSGVTTSTGYPILPGESLEIVFDPMIAVSVYVIAASAQALRVIEIN